MNRRKHKKNALEFILCFLIFIKFHLTPFYASYAFYAFSNF
jgi:hypothetical protein